MLLLAVVEEPLAVVGGEHDERVVVAAELAEPVEQLAERRVGRGDLALVGRAVARALGRGRRPGRVRLVEVDEQEERLAARAAQPVERPRHRLPAVALHLADRLGARGRRAPRRRSRSRRRARSRAAARRRRPRPRSRSRARAGASASVSCFGVELVADVVAHAVLRRQQAESSEACDGSVSGECV